MWSLVCETQSLQGCTCCGIDSSTATFEVHLFQQGLLQGPMPSEIGLLQHGLTHSHSPFRSKPVPTWPHRWLQSLQGCSCSVVGLSMATRFEVLQHDLMHSHWCTCCSTCCSMDHPQSRMVPSVPFPAWTSPWATAPSEVHLLQHRHSYGCRVSHPQGTVPLTQVHTGVPACPGQQRRTSSDALAACQPRPITTAAIKIFPGTALQQGEKAKTGP